MSQAYPKPATRGFFVFLSVPIEPASALHCRGLCLLEPAVPGAKGRSGGTRAGAGRKPKQPTSEQRAAVEFLAAIGISTDEMPRLLAEFGLADMSPPTLRKHFANEIEQGRTVASVKVARKLFETAMDGNVTAMIFWLKSQAGWKDSKHVQVSGINGGPVQSVNMTPDEFREIAKSISDEV